MTNEQTEKFIADYNGGGGMSIVGMAKKYYLTENKVRYKLKKLGVYNKTNKTALNDLSKAKELLAKVCLRHEGGLLPDRSIYIEIHRFLYGE